MNTKGTERLLYFLGFVDLFAVSILIPQIAINHKNKGYSALEIGLAGSLYGTIQTFSAPILGGYSDIHGRKRCISMTFLLSGIIYSLFAFIENVYWFLAARAVLGIFKHSNTMCKNYLCDIYAKKERVSFLGKFNAISSSGFIVGPLVGGYLANFEISCILVSIIFIISGLVAEVFLHNLKPVRTHNEVDGKDAASPQNDSFIHLCRTMKWSKFWHIMSGRLLCALSVNSYRSGLGHRLLTSYSLGSKGLGFIISIMGVVAALSSLLVGPLVKMAKGRILFVLVSCGFLLTASTILLYFSTSINQLVIFLMIFTAASSLIRVYGLDVLLSQGTGEDVGLLQGLSQSIASISRGLGPVMSGVADELHGDGAVILSGLLALLGTLAFTIVKQKPHRD